MGIALFVAHLAVYFAVWTGAVLSYTRATDENPFPTVFGLSFEQQGPALLWGVVIAELLFVSALYVAGPAWRSRLRQLFRYRRPTTPQPPEAPKPPPTFRYRLGLGVFAVGNILAIGGMLMPAFGLAKGRMVGVIALMLGAGEVLSLSSIFFLGKQGFKQLKSRLFGMLKRPAPGEQISQRRHRVGSILFAAHVALGFAALIFPIASHLGVATAGTFPTVLGLDRDQQLKWFLGLLIGSEVLFWIGVYALGAGWWERFRALFARDQTASSA
jgi:hypothetical protein